jgi:hypothetical protein
MLGILLMHCATLFWPAPGEPLPIPIQLGIQLAKFATIAFFLVAGYLLGKQLPKYTRKQYFWRRLSRLGPAWLAWFGLFCVLRIVGHTVLHPAQPLTLSEYIPVFSSTFWFVPNMLFAMLILLVISRYFDIDNWHCGLVLLLPSLFYAINIYTRWIEPQHTTALVGFVGYLWLGAWAGRHWDKVATFLGRISTSTLFSLSLFFFLLGILEIHLLVRLHSVDPLNSLRLSNQLYSISVVLLFSRITIPTWPRFLNVRESIFGVYLAQDPINMTVAFALKWVSLNMLDTFCHTTLGVLCTWGLRFALVYTFTLSITIFAARTSSLRWMVGGEARAKVPESRLICPAEAQPLG